MFKNILFGSFLTVALIPTGSFAQESVFVSGPVEIKKEMPPASGYEKLLEMPGRVVISKKYPVGDASLRMLVRVSYRENTPHLKVYTLHSINDEFSIDLEKLPLLISDLESFVRRVKAAKESDSEEFWYRYSEKHSVGFYWYRDDKGVWRSYYSGRPGTWIAQGPGTSTKSLETYIEGLKSGYAKLTELKRAR